MPASSPSPLNVVVLAAGRGERFSIAGISVPKPLIEFRGRSLLQRSVEVAREVADAHGPGRVIVVATEAAATQAERTKGVDRVVPVSVVQPGPVASGMLALAHLPGSEAVAFMDCDNYYPEHLRSWTSSLPIGLPFILTAPTPSGLSPTDFCNVKRGTVVLPATLATLAEKKDLGTGLVATGVYGFASAGQFRAFAHLALMHLEPEPPMSSLIRMAPGVVVCEAEAWLPIGTPAQFEFAAKTRFDGPVSAE